MITRNLAVYFNGFSYRLKSSTSIAKLTTKLRANLPGRIAQSKPIGSMCSTFSHLHRWNRSKYRDAPQPRQLSTATNKRNEIHIKYFNTNTKICFILPAAATNIIPEKKKIYHSREVLNLFFCSFCDPVSFNYTLCNVKNYLSLFFCGHFYSKDGGNELTFFLVFRILDKQHYARWNHAKNIRTEILMNEFT